MKCPEITAYCPLKDTCKEFHGEDCIELDNMKMDFTTCTFYTKETGDAEIHRD